MSSGILFAVNKSFKVGTKTFSVPEASLTRDTMVSLSTTIDKAASGFVRTMNVTKSLITGVGIKATKAVTIVTSGGDTFTLPDGGGVVWIKGEAGSCPITANFTSLTFTGNGTTDSDVEFHVQMDQPGAGS